jgi:hypothetical protein
VINYQKSIELNPNNIHGTRKLDEIYKHMSEINKIIK